jgi:hypothetical protein
LGSAGEQDEVKIVSLQNKKGDFLLVSHQCKTAKSSSELKRHEAKQAKQNEKSEAK